MSEEQKNTAQAIEVSEEELNQVQGGALGAEELAQVDERLASSARKSGVSPAAMTLQAGIGTAVGFGSSYAGQVIGKGGKTHPNH